MKINHDSFTLTFSTSLHVFCYYYFKCFYFNNNKNNNNNLIVGFLRFKEL